MKLTQKQKAFADYYIISLNATEAYMKAYPNASSETARRNGHKLLTRADIHAYVTDIMTQKHNERMSDAEEVLEFLSSVMRGQETEQVPLVLQREFKIIEKNPNLRDRIKAAELLGKRFALFTEKHNISGDLGLHINVDYGDDIEEG